MSAILSGFDGVLCVMDDVLVYGRDTKEHNKRLTEALRRIQAAGVTVNPSKCEFGKTELKFLGHLVGRDGVGTDPKKTSAITDMQAPTNITEMRRFMGMVNQLGKFSQNLADLTQPLRQLLSKESAWLWGPDQDRAFKSVKEELAKPTIFVQPESVWLHHHYGLGAVLMQRVDLKWKPVAYASRTMMETGKRYVQIEKEAVAATWACEKFSMYILEKRFLIETDHKPLVPLLGSKHIDSVTVYCILCMW